MRIKYICFVFLRLLLQHKSHEFTWKIYNVLQDFPCENLKKNVNLLDVSIAKIAKLGISQTNFAINLCLLNYLHPIEQRKKSNKHFLDILIYLFET